MDGSLLASLWSWAANELTASGDPLQQQPDDTTFMHLRHRKMLSARVGGVGIGIFVFFFFL